MRDPARGRDMIGGRGGYPDARLRRALTPEVSSKARWCDPSLYHVAPGQGTTGIDLAAGFGVQDLLQVNASSPLVWSAGKSGASQEERRIGSAFGSSKLDMLQRGPQGYTEVGLLQTGPKLHKTPNPGEKSS